LAQHNLCNFTRDQYNAVQNKCSIAAIHKHSAKQQQMKQNLTKVHPV